MLHGPLIGEHRGLLPAATCEPSVFVPLSSPTPVMEILPLSIYLKYFSH